MKSKITREEVIKMAKLAKLDVTGIEDKLAEMFSETVEKIQILNELDTSAVEETYNVSGLKDVFQSGAETATLSKEEALSNAKNVIRGLIATKGVFADR